MWERNEKYKILVREPQGRHASLWRLKCSWVMLWWKYGLKDRIQMTEGINQWQAFMSIGTSWLAEWLSAFWEDLAPWSYVCCKWLKRVFMFVNRCSVISWSEMAKWCVWSWLLLTEMGQFRAWYFLAPFAMMHSRKYMMPGYVVEHYSYWICPYIYQ